MGSFVFAFCLLIGITIFLSRFRTKKAPKKKNGEIREGEEKSFKEWFKNWKMEIWKIAGPILAIGIVLIVWYSYSPTTFKIAIQSKAVWPLIIILILGLLACLRQIEIFTFFSFSVIFIAVCFLSIIIISSFTPEGQEFLAKVRRNFTQAKTLNYVYSVEEGNDAMHKKRRFKRLEELKGINEDREWTKDEHEEFLEIKEEEIPLKVEKEVKQEKEKRILSGVFRLPPGGKVIRTNLWHEKGERIICRKNTDKTFFFFNERNPHFPVEKKYYEAKARSDDYIKLMTAPSETEEVIVQIQIIPKS